MRGLTPEQASRFARAALGHVTREWPNKLDHVLAGPADMLSPRALHHVFFGSYDWHSCVHGHWLLARIYRRFPDLPEASRIRSTLDEQFTDAKIAGEIVYLARPESRGFERPYGRAWMLMLMGEAARDASAEGRRWAAALKPLADAFVSRFRLPALSTTSSATVWASTGSQALPCWLSILSRIACAANKGDDEPPYVPICRRCGQRLLRMDAGGPTAIRGKVPGVEPLFAPWRTIRN